MSMKQEKSDVESGIRIDRISRIEKKCAFCNYWRPNVFYSFIGYCERHNKYTLDIDTCSFFEPLKINENKLYWCSTCKTRITGYEALQHVKEGHRVHRGAYVDPDIKEELYSVF